MTKTEKNNSKQGITMVELVFVISIIGILSAVVIGLINIPRQRQMAEEANLRANLTKTCAAIEAFYEGEDLRYPGEGVIPANRNPLDASAPDDDILSFYLNTWPATGYIYNSTATTFSVHIKQSLSDHFYKCNYSWNNVRECASTTDPNDPDDCDPIP